LYGRLRTKSVRKICQRVCKIKYRTIYADPPWHFRDTLDESRHKPYQTLSIEEIKNLRVDEITADKAHLYLWVVHSHLEKGLEVVKAWGFTYKTVIVWDKKTKNGKNWFGMGHYFRSSRELCLFGIKGGLKTQTNNTRDIFSAKKPDRHSGKPEKMYKIIEANSLPPYLELFAVQKRKGWDVWGKKVKNSVSLNLFSI